MCPPRDRQQALWMETISATRPRLLHEHLPHCSADFFNRGPPIVPLPLSSGREDRHRCIGLEEQHIAVPVQTEINSTIVQTQRFLDLLECRHSAGPEYAVHVDQELSILGAMLWKIAHVRAEVVNLPVVRDG